jgi:hypothetical protein
VTDYERLSLAYLAAIANGLAHVAAAANPLTAQNRVAVANELNGYRSHLGDLAEEVLAAMQANGSGAP